MVSDTPLDPMHMVDLGAMRRMLTFLFGLDQRGSIPNVTLIRAIDAYLISLRPYISRIDLLVNLEEEKNCRDGKPLNYDSFCIILGLGFLDST